jgi:hypothetical protein
LLRVSVDLERAISSSEIARLKGNIGALLGDWDVSARKAWK